jgi:deazaflavin-dependent oxidoreductase (nitroreductase family)
MPNPANKVPALILRSPLHRALSSRYLLIEFTGRKTGRIFRTPVAYVADDGDRVLLATDSPWWRNFTDPAPVRMWLRGREVTGTATALTDSAASEAVLRRLVDAIPSYARPAKLARDQQRKVSDAEVARAVAAGRVGIAVELTRGS